MKLKAWILWLFAAIGFSFVGVMYLIDKKNTSGITFIILGISYIILSIANYKKGNKLTETGSNNMSSKTMDAELMKLIEQGEKIKAIKEYRDFTGVGLKEAKDYVDSLSEKKIRL
jgi:Ribosomal protein L7/L12